MYLEEVRLEAKNLVGKLLQYFLARLKGRHTRNEKGILTLEWTVAVYSSQNDW